MLQLFQTAMERESSHILDEGDCGHENTRSKIRHQSMDSEPRISPRTQNRLSQIPLYETARGQLLARGSEVDAGEPTLFERSTSRPSPPTHRSLPEPLDASDRSTQEETVTHSGSTTESRCGTAQDATFGMQDEPKPYALRTHSNLLRSGAHSMAASEQERAAASAAAQARQRRINVLRRKRQKMQHSEEEMRASHRENDPAHTSDSEGAQTGICGDQATRSANAPPSRIIRNREAALRSRHKKAQQLNQALGKNQRLRSSICELERENEQLQSVMALYAENGEKLISLLNALPQSHSCTAALKAKALSLGGLAAILRECAKLPDCSAMTESEAHAIVTHLTMLNDSAI
mmetsp:Transcript_3500/g.9610  ORF Transcript_3500/g.9610 Transcript_3500/m.9610 type:complete len:349 (-) Transcript_3500:1027-2073(-)